MDDFRVGSIPPYDPIGRQPSDGSAGRKKRKLPDPQNEEEDVVSLSEHAAEEEEGGIGYGPRRDED